jgi:excalibur calcium-binding domain-containing protein
MFGVAGGDGLPMMYGGDGWGWGGWILMTLAMANADVYYKNCSEARAAGVTPLYEGDPGYAPHLPGVALRELWTAARC